MRKCRIKIVNCAPNEILLAHLVPKTVILRTLSSIVGKLNAKNEILTHNFHKLTNFGILTKKNRNSVKT